MTENKTAREITYLEAVREAMSQEMRRDAEVFLFGEDVEEADAEKLGAFIESLNGDVEVEIHNGKQPLYPYILAVE